MYRRYLIPFVLDFRIGKICGYLGGLGTFNWVSYGGGEDLEMMALRMIPHEFYAAAVRITALNVTLCSKLSGRLLALCDIIPG